MLRPWPTSTTLPLSLLSLLLACSSAGVEQDTDTTDDKNSTSNESGSDPTNGPTGDPTNTPTTDAPTTDDSSPTEVTSVSDTTGQDPVTATTSASATDTGPDGSTSTAGTTGDTDTTGAETASEGDSSTGPVPEGCVDALQNGDETDVDCGGSCPACTIEQMCTLDADCDSLSCVDSKCAEATCDDGKLDGAETDVDCGGDVCDPCLDGDSCLVGDDCESAVCTENVCEAPACDDKVKNQDETDVDCGGGCDPCANDQACLLDADCESLACEDNKCVAATCDDGVQNGPETGIDCGGPACAPCQLEGLIINEVDYDQVGDDVNEFVEIFNNTGADVDLANIRLVLVNGTNNTTYRDTSLAAAGILKQGAYLVVASNTVVLPPDTPSVKYAAAKDNVQNGNPDGIALINVVDKTLLDALSYGGALTMANVTGLGVVSLVEGTALKANVIDSNMNVGSLIRFPNGNDKNDANTEWIFGKNPTPGAANVP